MRYSFNPVEGRGLQGLRKVDAMGLEGGREKGHSEDRKGGGKRVPQGDGDTRDTLKAEGSGLLLIQEPAVGLFLGSLLGEKISEDAFGQAGKSSKQSPSPPP